VFGQVICNTISAWIHSIFAFVPVCRADFTVFLEKLQGVNHAYGFVNASAQRQVIDDAMPYNSFLVDQE
jgi:hypothetical protein